MHIAQLRKELDDPLYCRRPSGLAFTPGGLRLASRAVEILGLQQQTALEVSQAGNGRRLLRIAASPLFAEHAAPGLIDLFAGRAKDLSVELSVHPVRQFANLISSRAVDVALGPRVLGERQPLCLHPFLQYEVLTVCAPQHPMARTRPSLRQLREQQWFLGPSAAGGDGVMRHMLRALDIPHERQRIFQSDAAAVEAVRRSGADAGTRLCDRRRTVGRFSRPRRRSGIARGRRMVRHDPAPPAPPARRYRTAALRQHTAMHPGDDPRHRRRRRPLQTQGARHTLELTPDARITPNQQVCSWPRLRSSVG